MPAKPDLNSQLESNFSKLNYVNKIQILLKALMVEREKSRENSIKLKVMKQEYIKKVEYIVQLRKENEELIDKVANAEV